MDGSVRLVDGDNYDATVGRVEYCIGGRWGTVCKYEWSDADAKVVCRQLGSARLGTKTTTSSSRTSYNMHSTQRAKGLQRKCTRSPELSDSNCPGWFELSRN